MTYSVQVVADSISGEGKRLTSMVVSFPRIVLPEFLTHRVFSRNTASSRAIPVAKLLERVSSDPFVPFYWGKNQKGMEAQGELEPDLAIQAEKEWLRARNEMMSRAANLMNLGVHKQLANRLLEPWLYTTVLVSSTTYRNFFWLRNNSKAQPEIRKLAEMMQDAYQNSAPTYVGEGGWHLPFLREEDKGLPETELRKVMTARCARLSYLTHNGVRDAKEDLRLYSDLARSEHWSPFEHIATPCSGRHGNFDGWKQYRQLEDTADYT